MKKIVIIGAVAAGTKAGAKLKRLDQSLDITIVTKGKDISYAGCGLPYYVGGLIHDRSELIVNTPEKFTALTGVKVLVGREVYSLKPEEKRILARDVDTGAEESYSYDSLIIATGASSVVPPIQGADLPGVFTLRTPDDATAMRTFVDDRPVRRAVVVGGGFIGLEVAENLQVKGVAVTVVDVAPQILPNVFDREMADWVKGHLKKQGIQIYTGVKVSAITGDDNVVGVTTDIGNIAADMVVLSVGIRPNTAFLADTGIEMVKGTIVVDSKLRTNLPDVYAAGDCVMVTNRLTGKPQWSPMGSSANMEARTMAQAMVGMDKNYPGVLGTGVVKLPSLNCGRTGLTEAQAIEAGYDVVTALDVTDDKAHYYPGSGSFTTKLIADKTSRKLLGVQVLGPGAVDKMVDIAVTGISLGAKVEDFDNLDYAYAPPFSTAIHPFVQAIYLLENKMDGEIISMTPTEYLAGAAEGYTVLDVAPTPNISGAKFIDLGKVDGPIDGLNKDDKLLLVCLKGKRGYFLQRRLRSYGYTNTCVLEGATAFNDIKVPGATVTVSPADITRVKALGFLFDKRTSDRFNCRVITRNGKITAEESRAITEAAELYGDGQIAMTSRLTMEIQSVPYENVDAIREYLAKAGLETGGTGSKVRPVVSCKGTTCQYGLIDTFALSEEIHRRFYEGYKSVKLPHKFKIAVGGCPNNCVKPDLNDLGIIGQRIPEIDLSKCRGCKNCQVVNICPVKVASVVDGKVVIDLESCNHCGRCIGTCPFKAITDSTTGYRVYIGGRWGKRVAQGRYLDKVFTDEAAVLDVVEKAILLFREQGITGERFSDTIARLGFENVQEQLLSDDLLRRKEENLTAQTHLKGGATC